MKCLPCELDGRLAEHRHDALDRLLPDLALVLHGHAERLELGDRGAFAHAELDAAAAQQIECRDPLGDAGGMVGGQLDDAVTEADALGALAGGAEEHLRRRRVGVFLEEVVLDLPGVVVAQLVGQLDLVERIEMHLHLGMRFPGLGDLQLVEDAEFH